MKAVLPVYYYHDHFTEMLFFVSETYRPVLTERHRAFVETFKGTRQDWRHGVR
jgi:DNA polymerase III subunit epsilon